MDAQEAEAGADLPLDFEWLGKSASLAILRDGTSVPRQEAAGQSDRRSGVDRFMDERRRRSDGGRKRNQSDRALQKCRWLAISSGPLDDIANCHRA